MAKNRPSRLSGLSNLEQDLGKISENDSLAEEQLKALITSLSGEKKLSAEDEAILVRKVAGKSSKEQIELIKAGINDLTKGKAGRPKTVDRERFNTMMNSELKNRLRRAAWDEGKSMADIIEELIEVYLEQKGY